MAVVPLSAFPLAIYLLCALFLYDTPANIVATGDVALHPFWDSAAVIVTLVSGQRWSLTYGDGLIIFALFMLLLATLRAANGRDSSVVANLMTVVVLCIHVVLFLTVGAAGTSLFFIITVIALMDTLTNVSVSMVASHSRVEAVPTDT